MEKIEAFKPKCCNKAYITKKACLEHEKRCMWNPDNKACHTCAKKRVITVNDFPSDEKRWYCPVRDKLVGIFGSGNEMMPESNCDAWELN